MRVDHLDLPHRARFGPASPGYGPAMAAHRRAVDLGLSTYRDPATGYLVMTAAYLAERGYCCHAGCRHCPYLGA